MCLYVSRICPRCQLAYTRCAVDLPSPAIHLSFSESTFFTRSAILSNLDGPSCFSQSMTSADPNLFVLVIILKLELCVLTLAPQRYRRAHPDTVEKNSFSSENIISLAQPYRMRDNVPCGTRSPYPAPIMTRSDLCGNRISALLDIKLALSQCARFLGSGLYSLVILDL